jgi:hypothetical protein
MLRRPSDGVLLAITGLALSVPAVARDKGDFPPPSGGHPFQTDYPRISEIYRGTWADEKSNCYATNDRGRQVSISDIAIGLDPVLKVEAYSDERAIIVTTQSGDGGTELIFLDVSLDDRHLRIRMNREGKADILVRCPPPGKTAPVANIGDKGWVEQAQNACRAGEFEAFFEAFLSSTLVQRRYLASRIKMRWPARSASVPDHQYLRIPIMRYDWQYALNQGRPGAEKVKLDILADPDGGYRVSYVRATFNDKGEGDSPGEIVETFGPVGTLVFESQKGCWRLVEESVGYPD